MHSKLLPLILATAALAIPAPSTNTATCSLVYDIFWGQWTVKVGRPYLNGKGCPYVKDKIKDAINLSSSPGFKCVDDGAGGTQLQFATDIKTKEVNEALQAAYPMIPFIAHDICDPYLPNGV